ncbi:MAG: hypothetical protein QW098_05745 [Candidatus Hadarchaeales archaeon]
MKKLEGETDYEAIVELCVLISSHYLNAALHKLGVTPQDRDVKHNRLAGEIRRRRVKELQGALDAIDGLEQLRPRHVYGRGGDGEVAGRAMAWLGEVRKACSRVLG